MQRRILGSADARDPRGDPSSDHEREECRDDRPHQAAEAHTAPARDAALDAGLVRTDRGADEPEDDHRDHRGKRADDDRRPADRPRRPRTRHGGTVGHGLAISNHRTPPAVSFSDTAGAQHVPVHAF